MSPEQSSPDEFSKLFDTETVILDKSDVFALGVGLFTIVAGRPPFVAATKRDPFYRFLLFQKRKAMFWKRHPSQDRIAQMSTEFKDLVERMLDPDPASRISLEEVKEHPWMLEHCDLEPARNEVQKSLAGHH